MKIYIAGKITGDRHYKRKFARVERKLSRKGHGVMNPARLGAHPDFTWKDYMVISGAMLRRCSAILMLPDWRESKGALIEYELAKKRKMAFFFDLRDIPKEK